jgi:hypothetical protein
MALAWKQSAVLPSQRETGPPSARELRRYDFRTVVVC